ncbi:MAG: hypothetical protein SchgKO_10540 [Schleiferiaceae bacterium]
MKNLLTLLFLLPIIVFGQNQEKQYYRGNKLPFTICFLTVSDTGAEVEYFYKKGSKVFAYVPPIKLTHGLESSSSKPFLVSENDSIQIFVKSKYLKVKNKGDQGKVKVYKTNNGEVELRMLRNNYALSKFTDEQVAKLETHPNFDIHVFYRKLHQYNLRSQTDLTEEKFAKKLEEVEGDLEVWIENSNCFFVMNYLYYMKDTLANHLKGHVVYTVFESENCLSIKPQFNVTDIDDLVWEKATLGKLDGHYLVILTDHNAEDWLECLEVLEKSPEVISTFKSRMLDPKKLWYTSYSYLGRKRCWE